MRKLKIGILVVGLALLQAVVFFQYPFAETIEIKTTRKGSLRGLSCVYVCVDELQPNAKDFKLKKDSIQKDLESKISAAGIKILKKDAWLETAGNPRLYINLTSSITNDLVVYSINISLQQNVYLARDQKMFVYDATTWITGYMGGVGIARAEPTIRNAIKDQMDIFINDYLAVNPKK